MYVCQWNREKKIVTRKIAFRRTMVKGVLCTIYALQDAIVFGESFNYRYTSSSANTSRFFFSLSSESSRWLDYIFFFTSSLWTFESLTRIPLLRSTLIIQRIIYWFVCRRWPTVHFTTQFKTWPLWQMQDEVEWKMANGTRPMRYIINRRNYEPYVYKTRYIHSNWIDWIKKSISHCNGHWHIRKEREIHNL